ncbi:transglycosylase SLT domain-containing protein [Micromonospora sp. NPDC049366]|uniref:transglycosylase SLT domain-containing protein n=1 Tax=Micromonospora sp. NPDC049366 TaxID=3364271 RepID=UPI0037A5CADA
MRRRLGGWVAVVTAGVLLVTAGCAGEQARPQDLSQQAPVAAEVAGEASAEPVAADAPTRPAVQGLGGAPRRSVPPSTKPTPPTVKTSRPAGPRAVPKPPTETRVPPPPSPPPAGCTKPRYEGTQASRAQVKTALTNAAERTYWPTSAPDIAIPLNLLKATAWQESGWQSNIIACDGGVGLMQVMPDTATWMNQRFGQSYKIDVYQDNAYLGGTYLAWLTKYIGDMYFDADYRLDASLCTSELNSCLLNAVIAAYNYGHGAVAREGEPLTIPNPQYVRNVRALMTECECLSF